MNRQRLYKVFHFSLLRLSLALESIRRFLLSLTDHLLPNFHLKLYYVKMTQPTSQESTLTMFELLKPAVGDAGASRIGRLVFAGGRRTMQTPNFIAVASRGVIPHLTPDNVAKHTTFDAAYMAIEDCTKWSL